MDYNEKTPQPGASRDIESHREPATSEAASRVRSEAENVKNEAEHRLRSAAEGGKEAAAENVGSVVRALRKTAEELEHDRQGTAARYVTWAADGLDRISSDLRDKDVDTVLRQAQSFARRQPAVFFGGALTTGFLLARFLTSASERTHGERTHEEKLRREPIGPPRTEPVASPPTMLR